MENAHISALTDETLLLLSQFVLIIITISVYVYNVIKYGTEIYSVIFFNKCILHMILFKWISHLSSFLILFNSKL